MKINELKNISEIFTEVVQLRNREQRIRCQKELETCYTIEQEIQRDNDIIMSKSRESAFQEVLNLIREKKNEKVLDTNAEDE